MGGSWAAAVGIQAACQLPTLKEFGAMAVPPPAPNAGAGMPAAPGQAGAANNATREQAVQAHRFVANAAMAGVGQPIIVDKANAAAMCWPRRINNMEVFNGLNWTILQSTAIIGEMIRARGATVAAGERGRGGEAVEANCKLELRHKQRTLAIEVGD